MTSQNAELTKDVHGVSQELLCADLSSPLTHNLFSGTHRMEPEPWCPGQGKSPSERGQGREQNHLFSLQCVF